MQVTPGSTPSTILARNRDTEAEAFRPVSEKHHVSSSVFYEHIQADEVGVTSHGKKTVWIPFWTGSC